MRVVLALADVLESSTAAATTFTQRRDGNGNGDEDLKKYTNEQDFTILCTTFPNSGP
jgi:hypothetical protein